MKTTGIDVCFILCYYQLRGQSVLIRGTMGTCSYVLTGTQQGMKETYGTTFYGTVKGRFTFPWKCLMLVEICELFFCTDKLRCWYFDSTSTKIVKILLKCSMCFFKMNKNKYIHVKVYLRWLYTCISLSLARCFLCLFVGTSTISSQVTA